MGDSDQSWVYKNDPWVYKNDLAASSLPRRDYSSRHLGPFAAYQTCSMRWGHPEAQLSLLDMAIFAKYAYAQCNDTYKNALNETFNNSGQDWGLAEVVNFTDYQMLPRLVHSRIVPKSKTPGTS